MLVMSTVRWDRFVVVVDGLEWPTSTCQTQLRSVPVDSDCTIRMDCGHVVDQWHQEVAVLLSGLWMNLWLYQRSSTDAFASSDLNSYYVVWWCYSLTHRYHPTNDQHSRTDYCNNYRSTRFTKVVTANNWGRCLCTTGSTRTVRYSARAYEVLLLTSNKCPQVLSWWAVWSNRGRVLYMAVYCGQYYQNIFSWAKYKIFMGKH